MTPKNCPWLIRTGSFAHRLLICLLFIVGTLASGCIPTLTPTPTATSSSMLTNIPTPSPPSPTAASSNTPTSILTAYATTTTPLFVTLTITLDAPTATLAPTLTLTATETPKTTPGATATPSETPSPTWTPTPTVTDTLTLTPQPTPTLLVVPYPTMPGPGGVQIEDWWTLNLIARTFGLTLEQLVLSNPNHPHLADVLTDPAQADSSAFLWAATDPDHVIVVVPQRDCYTVMKGDYLSLIAVRLGTTTTALVEANEGKYPTLRTIPNYVEIGWVLCRP